MRHHLEKRCDFLGVDRRYDKLEEWSWLFRKLKFRHLRLVVDESEGVLRLHEVLVNCVKCVNLACNKELSHHVV